MQRALINTQGIDIAFVGIDGIGKSSLSRALADRLREDGHAVTEATWRSYLSHQPATFEQELFSDLFIQLTDALYRDAVLVGGTPAAAMLPGDKASYFDRSFLRDLESIEIQFNDPSSIAAAGYLELAGTLMFQELVTQPVIDRGGVLVQESHGLRSLLKFAMLAEHSTLAGVRSKAHIASALDEVLPDVSPRVCVLVTGDPHQAMRQRLDQSGSLGVLEHYGLAGGSRDTFIEFQSELQRRLEVLSDQHDWIQISMPNTSLTNGLDLSLNRILTDRRVRQWRETRPRRTR